MSDVEERVKKVISEVLKVDPGTIKPSDEFRVELGASSLQSVELVAAFEEEFEIEMDEDDALSCNTVQAAIDYISKCLEEQSGGA